MVIYSKMSKNLYRRCGWYLNGGGSGLQARPEFFQGFHCCDLVWELVPVDNGSREGVPVNLMYGSLLVELVSSTGSTVSTL